MVEIFPSALIFLPILLVTVSSRKRSLFYLVASVPFFGITVFEVLSHRFIPAEIAAIGLLLNQLFRWGKSEDIRIPWTKSYSWFSIYLGISAFSVIYVVLDPAAVQVNPYESYAGDFQWVTVSLSRHHITQLILRVFPILLFIIISMNIREEEIPAVIRLLIIGGLIAGVSGVLFQLSILTEWDLLLDAGRWFGDMEQAFWWSYLGPIPRMGSISGEPGHIAQFLLYLLAISVTLYLSGSEQVFRRKSLSVVIIALIVLLGLSTSATGYGGIFVLIGFIFIMGLLADQYETDRILELLMVLLTMLLLFSAIMIYFGLEFGGIVEYQLNKIQFKAGSGSLRYRYLVKSLAVATHRPFIGIGTGSYYPMSLFGSLLGETGLLGLFSFIIACTISSRECIWHIRNKTLRNHGITLAVVNGVLTILTVSLIAKSITTILSPWFWMAIALPIAIVVSEREKHHQKRCAANYST